MFLHTESRSGNPLCATHVSCWSDLSIVLPYAHVWKVYFYLPVFKCHFSFTSPPQNAVFSSSVYYSTAVQAISLDSPSLKKYYHVTSYDILCASSLCRHCRGHESMNKPWPVNCKVFGNSWGDSTRGGGGEGARARAQGWAINEISWLYLVFWQLEVIGTTFMSLRLRRQQQSPKSLWLTTQPITGNSTKSILVR